MATIDDLQKEFEARLAALISELSAHGQASEANVALVRALIHKAVHVAAERKGIEFCALATFLGEMIGHAHQLMHGSDKNASTHEDVVH